DGRVERVERYARSARLSARIFRQLARSLLHGVFELTGRVDRVDQPPLDRALAFDAFGERGETVGQIAADSSFVDDARQPAGAGENAEQRHFRKAHGRVTVVDQDDLVARQRQLVSAPGADAVERRAHRDAGALARVLDREPSLVGELAEV